MDSSSNIQFDTVMINNTIANGGVFPFNTLSDNKEIKVKTFYIFKVKAHVHNIDF